MNRVASTSTSTAVPEIVISWIDYSLPSDPPPIVWSSHLPLPRRYNAFVIVDWFLTYFSLFVCVPQMGLLLFDMGTVAFVLGLWQYFNLSVITVTLTLLSIYGWLNANLQVGFEVAPSFEGSFSNASHSVVLHRIPLYTITSHPIPSYSIAQCTAFIHRMSFLGTLSAYH